MVIDYIEHKLRKIYKIILVNLLKYLSIQQQFRICIFQSFITQIFDVIIKQ